MAKTFVDSQQAEAVQNLPLISHRDHVDAAIPLVSVRSSHENDSVDHNSRTKRPPVTKRPLSRKQKLCWSFDHDFGLSIFLAWLPEIAALIMALTCLLTIYVVLRKNKGREVASLNISGRLTLNGAVAILATILRVSLLVPVASAVSQEIWLWMIQNGSRTHPRSRLGDISLSDAGSRGVWGSIKLVFLSPRLIPLLGSITTILSLFIGISSQQLIVIKSLNITDINSPLQPGTIPRTEYYENTHGNSAQGDLDVRLDMKAAIYGGMMSNSTIVVPPTCPTTNCTFPLTPSIAVNASCVKTDYQILGCNDTSCDYLTSTGSQFTLANFNKSFEGVGFATRPSVVTLTSGLFNATAAFAAFDMIGVPYAYEGDYAYLQSNIISSSQCSLWLALSLYNTTVESGVQQQACIDTTINVPDANSRYTGGDTWTFTFPERWQRAAGTRNNNGSDIVYQVDASSWGSLNNAFSSLTSGSVELTDRGYKASSDGIEAIWYGTNNQSAWVQNLALSMTNVVKSASQQGLQRPEFNGTASQLRIDIQWWWLALPAFLTLTSGILLIVIVIRTGRSSVGHWKGNPLTMLLFEVDEKLRQIGTENCDGATPMNVGREIEKKRATLMKMHDGRWLLKGQ